VVRAWRRQDLRRWKPLKEHSPAERWKGGVLAPRPELFDSALVEPGPPAALIGDYIVLLYNGAPATRPRRAPAAGARGAGSGGGGAGAPDAGKNARYDKGGTRELFMGVYSVGQAVMAAADPTKVLHRAGEPLLVPDQPFETEGQVCPPPAPPRPAPPRPARAQRCAARALRQAGLRAQFGMERVVFAQGLVHHRGRWLLYYGAGHSFIGVAKADETPALADGTAWLR
jgi:hypothetical protein